ncbi:hypothetical protein ALC57_00869 [Trachymyrmex cornetzi]|uniref:Uncharacterized protein n=1 Tax=Trachymyrmex cornetzi TaxID=471704 RepID=A0A195ENX3_9HYME|nr:hypothetical protein ALC57_00869 [Trachymyrmex cornetzi]
MEWGPASVSGRRDPARGPVWQRKPECRNVVQWKSGGSDENGTHHRSSRLRRCDIDPGRRNLATDGGSGDGDGLDDGPGERARNFISGPIRYDRCATKRKPKKPKGKAMSSDVGDEGGGRVKILSNSCRGTNSERRKIRSISQRTATTARDVKSRSKVVARNQSSPSLGMETKRKLGNVNPGLPNSPCNPTETHSSFPVGKVNKCRGGKRPASSKPVRSFALEHGTSPKCAMIYFAEPTFENIVQQRDLPSMTIRDAGLTSGAYKECSRQCTERRTATREGSESSDEDSRRGAICVYSRAALHT